MSLSGLLKRAFSTPPIRKWFFDKAGYNKYGLYRDDCLNETPDVVEAIRRLPQKVKDERVYRIIRAHQLTLTHTILPENEWTKFEDDENNRYLMPYLNEVEREKKERAQWAKAH